MSPRPGARERFPCCLAWPEPSVLVGHATAGEGANLPTIRGIKGVSSEQLREASEDEFSDQSLRILRPTATHMALVTLYRAGIVKFLCTQVRAW